MDYTSYAGAGSACSIYDGCSTVNGVSNLWTPGGGDPTGNLGAAGYTAFLAHNNGVGTSFWFVCATIASLNGSALAGSFGGSRSIAPNRCRSSCAMSESRWIWPW